jgi:hypothetical protein
MKKWIIIVAILICCVLYALVKFSKPQVQNKTNRAENAQIEERTDAGNTNNDPLAESTSSAVPPPPVKQFEAIEDVTKAFTEFQSCLKDENYEQAWNFTSEYFKQRACNGSFEKFKEFCYQKELATATIHSKSAVVLGGRLGLLISSPSLEKDLYLFFIEEDGHWKLYIWQEK